MPGLRPFVLTTHRWMGLFSSLILTVAGATGAIMVWPGNSLIRKAAGRLHETLALGRPGALVVLTATAIAVLLELGGLYLWWQRKALRVQVRSGWKRAAFDLHHLVGAVGFVLMIVIATTAVLAFALGPAPTRQTLMRLHTGNPFGTPVRVLYSLASLGFAVQGGSGVVMWLRRRGSL
ncbi:MAG: PepSY domain-containing protein [Vicinamibacterales bacterium]